MACGRSLVDRRAGRPALLRGRPRERPERLRLPRPRGRRVVQSEGVGSTEPPKSGGAGFTGTGAGSGVGSTEPPKSGGAGFTGTGAGSGGGSTEPPKSGGAGCTGTGAGSGIGSTEPPKSGGAGFAGAGAGSGVGSTEPPKSGGVGFTGTGAGKRLSRRDSFENACEAASGRDDCSQRERCDVRRGTGTAGVATRRRRGSDLTILRGRLQHPALPDLLHAHTLVRSDALARAQGDRIAHSANLAREANHDHGCGVATAVDRRLVLVEARVPATEVVAEAARRGVDVEETDGLRALVAKGVDDVGEDGDEGSARRLERSVAKSERERSLDDDEGVRVLVVDVRVRALLPGPVDGLGDRQLRCVCEQGHAPPGADGDVFACSRFGAGKAGTSARFPLRRRRSRLLRFCTGSVEPTPVRLRRAYAAAAASHLHRL